jgi:hypothetical protein
LLGTWYWVLGAGIRSPASDGIADAGDGTLKSVNTLKSHPLVMKFTTYYDGF